MRLIVFFDLPTQTKKDKRNYLQFHKFLIENGFFMIQYSVYVRITRNHDDLDKYKKRVQMNLPSTGEVRSMEVTDKQYENMEILLGQKTAEEEMGSDCVVII